MDYVVHAAAVVGGIGANRRHPARFFYDNGVMGIHLIEEARRAGIRKLVIVGTVCSYPKFTAVPFTEDHLWTAIPRKPMHPTASPRRCCWCRRRRITPNTGSLPRS